MIKKKKKKGNKEVLKNVNIFFIIFGILSFVSIFLDFTKSAVSDSIKYTGFEMIIGVENLFDLSIIGFILPLLIIAGIVVAIVRQKDFFISLSLFAFALILALIFKNTLNPNSFGDGYLETCEYVYGYYLIVIFLILSILTGAFKTYLILNRDYNTQRR